MVLNGVGIRTTATILKTSHVNVLNWLKNANKILLESLERHNTDFSDEIDVIEMDEIYTTVKKGGNDSPFGLLTLGEKSVLLRL